MLNKNQMLFIFCVFALILNSFSYKKVPVKSRYILKTSSFFSDESLPRGLNILLSSNTDEQESSGPKVASKGFGTAKKIEAEVVEKDAGTKTYENQAKRGVPEYNIFIRPTNGTEGEWVPVGSMTIPRDTKVSKAVFEVEEELLKGTFKLYPKLKAFYDVRVDKEGIFEYGYCLKAFPDEPIIVIKKDEEQSKNFFTNWLNRLTNPIDTTTLNNPGQMTIKQ